MSVIGSNALAGASGQGGGGFVIEKSLRFNSGDSANLSRTPSSSSNRNKYTWSCWVKRCQLGGTTHYLFSAQDGSNVDFLGFEADSIMWYNAYSGGVTSTDKFRDTSAWYHVVFSVDSTQATAADRVKIYVNNRQITSFSSSLYPSQNRDFAINHTVAHSIGHYGGSYSSNFYLAEVHFVDGQVLTPADFAAYDDNNVWQAKEYTGTYGTNGFYLDFADGSNIGADAAGSNNWTANNLTDYSNSPNGSGSVTAGAPFNATYPWTTAFDGSITSVGAVGNTSGANDYVWTFGTTLSGTNAAFVVYSTYAGDFDNGNHASINGTALTSSNWTKTTNTLPVAEGNPGDYSVYTFSLGGSNLSSVGVGSNVRIAAVLLDGVPLIFDSAGDNDVLRDSPTNGDATADTGNGGEVSGNYCTMNAVHSFATLENGNLDVKPIVGHSNNYGTFGMSSGKWYWEVYRGAYSANSGAIGFHGSASANKKLGTTWPGPGSNTDQHTFYLNAAASGILYNGQGGASHSFTGSSTPTLPTGWVSDAGHYMFCVDMDNQKAWIGKDGVWWGWNGSAYTTTGGDPANGTNPTFVLDANDTYFPFNGAYSTSAGNYTFVHNFGQRPFAYTAPSGFKALCTANLPTPDIADGSAYFDTTIYTGTSASQPITGLEFSPDLVWLKQRGTGSTSHALFDTIRGGTDALQSDTNAAEQDLTSGNSVTFNSDGFTLGADTAGFTNYTGRTYVGWTWDAGSSNTTVSAGGLNSSLYDQSQTWSTYGTFDNNWQNSDYHWDDVFNTTLTNNGAGSLYVDGTTKDTWNLSSSYAVSNTIKVYTQNPTEITINEGLSSEKVVTSDGGNTLHYFAFSFTGNVESVGVRHASGGGIYLMGIWFDGKQLVDDTETPANLPSLASTYRANPSAGFSIVNYTSNAGNLETIAHGLGVAPEFVLCKRLDTAGDWWAGHVGAGWDKGGYLQVPDAFAVAPNWWQSTAPTSELVTLGSYPLTGSSGNYIAYCWAPVAGYSAMGSYTGNGSTTQGAFVNTNFRPAWILIKRVAGGSYSSWAIYDSTRSTFNTTGTSSYNFPLWANRSAEEGKRGDGSSAASGAENIINFFSNGFMALGAGAELNVANETYLYVAFASNPFQANGGLAF